jgi:hypothetical protein
MPGNDSVFWVNEYQCRPCANGILLPEVHISIVDDRMINAVAQDGITHTVCELFLIELRRMYADDSELIREGLFKLTQLRECMHTVDSTECPEVDDEDVTT